MRRLNLPALIVLGVALIALDMLSCSLAHAAKILVSWTPPTQNTDGTPLTDLAGYRIEWGSCDGPNFGATQASILVNNPGATSAAVYPTGLPTVCIRAYARNSAGAESGPSNVAVKTLSTLGKPIPLGQPITLP